MESNFPTRLLTMLLALYPRKIRKHRGAELEEVYRDMWAELESPGLMDGLVFRVRLTMDLFADLSVSWWPRNTTANRSGTRHPIKATEGLAVMGKEVAIAVRRLARTPGFSSIAIITLALGIAANTVVFTLINGVYLKPLPFPEPDDLVYLQEADGGLQLSTSHDAFQFFQQETASFEALGAYQSTSMVLREGENPVRLNSARISANLFSILGTQPFRGRGFFAEEDDPGSELVVILSYSLWQSQFGGKDEIVGSGIRLGEGEYLVAGVMPPDFRFPHERTQCWVPLQGLVRDPTYRALSMIGRLNSSASLESAADEVMAVGRRLEEANSAAKGGEFTYLRPLRDRLVPESYQATFMALGVAVAFLLLIAGANLTNLLLARASTRKAEIAVRKALGASRKRMALTGVAEPLVLSLASGCLGILGAFWGTDLIVRLSPSAIPRRAEIGLDPGVIVFGLSISLLAGLLIGLASISRSHRSDISAGMQSGGRVSRGQPLLSMFTIAQVSLTFALLAGVGLMAKTVQNLQSVDVGFEPDQAFAVNLGLSSTQYPDPPSRLSFYDEAVERTREVQWISAAGYTSFMPLDGHWNDSEILFEGHPTPPDELPSLEYDLATPGFFEAMGIQTLRGRLFDGRDRLGDPPVAVLNESAAHIHFPDGKVLGRRFALSTDGDPLWISVVGVVEDVRHHDIAEVPTPKFYLPFSQFPRWWPFGLNMVLRTVGPETPGTPGMIRDLFQDMSTGGTLVEISPLQARLDQFVEGPRFNALLLGIFTFSALGLAALGLYGVVAFGVTQRRKEIGLRMAMGANRMRIQRETIWKGMRLTLIGVMLGIPVALLMGRVLTSMLFGINTFDTLMMTWILVFLAGVSVLACVVPSLQAGRIPPASALKVE